MVRRILLLFCVTCGAFAEEVYHFSGKHFIASYLECDLKALSDLGGMIEAMNKAVAASGATQLEMNSYVFPPNAVTAVYLLSESHASIHTYPEHGSCFVDLFTCGEKCSAEKFDAVLRAYLQPQKISFRYFQRGEENQEIEFTALEE